jgi:hypothetical protein
MQCDVRDRRHDIAWQNDVQLAKHSAESSMMLEMHAHPRLQPTWTLSSKL